MKPFLDHELWEDGHLSPIAILAVGDGQDALVGVTGLEHANQCEHCLARVAEASVLAIETAVALEPIGAMNRVPASSVPARRAIALGAVISALGAIPTLAAVPERAENATRFLLKGASVLARVILHEAHAGATPLSVSLTLGAVFVFVVTGILAVTAFSKVSRERSVV